MAPADEPPAVLSIARGRPDEAEIAVVTAVVLAALSGGGQEPAAGAARAGSQWADRSRLLRPELSRGPGAWRASALPR